MGFSKSLRASSSAFCLRLPINVYAFKLFLIVLRFALTTFVSPAASQVLRRALALDPDGAVLEELFLPDGDGAFEFADGPLAGLEGRAAVRGADGDDDRGLADVRAAG